MKWLRQLVGISSILVLITIFSQNPDLIQAQPKVVVPIVVSPQAPTINPVAPYGMQRGSTLEVIFTGTNLQDPLSVWTSFPAKVTVPTDNNNGKDAVKLRVKLEVPPDAPIGFGMLRLMTKNGISNARLFCVDDLPQVLELETNKTKDKAQEVPFPSVVVGKVEIESSDFFKIRVKANQRVSIEVIGRRLGTPVDPVLFVHDAKTGREMGKLHSDDAPGLQTDARLTHIFPEAGEYLIEIRDTLHRGGADFGYRLRIGDFPLAVTPYPIAMKRGTKSLVNFAGPSVDGVSPVEVTAPTDPGKSVVDVAPKRAEGNLGWPVSVLMSDMEQIVEVEPNNDPAKAQRINVPCGVSARFLEKGDLDHFIFTAKKGQKYAITAETYEINSPCEVYLVLKNDKKADIAKSNPQTPTARIEFTPEADGDFTVCCEHLNYAHGPNEIYHLTVSPAEADFDVILGLDRFDVAPGGGTMIPVMGLTRRDYTGPIELSVTGHPSITGTVTIPANNPAPQPNQAVALMPISVKGDLPSGAYEIRVQAKATINGKEIIKIANVTELTKQNLGGLIFPPRPFLTSLAVGVTDKPIFVLSTKLGTPEILRGVPLNLIVSAKREATATEDIVLAVVGLPPNVTVVPKNIPKGKNDIELPITADGKAALGSTTIVVRASTKAGGKEFAYYSGPINLVIVSPVEVKLEPTPFSLKPGDKKKAKVTTTRKGGYDGPIDVELKNLPVNVTSAKATIPKGQNMIEIEVIAAPNAVAGEKPDVNALATATGAGNQQATSANITVRIEKVDKK